MPISAPPATGPTTISASSLEPSTFNQRDLDELIPPPLSNWRKLGVSLILVSLTICWVWLATSGYLVPQVANDGNIRVSGPEYVDHDEGLVALVVRVRNQGDRALRLTNIRFDGPGAEVVRVGLAPLQLYDESEVSVSVSESGSTTITRSLPPGEFFAVPDSDPLPAVLPVWHSSPLTSSMPQVLIWIRPSQCHDQSAPWGNVELTFDFGDGAIPPISRTYRSSEPAWSGGSVSMWGGDDFVQADGPLALACEVLQ